MGIFSKIKNSVLDIVGDAIGFATVVVDHNLSSKELRDRTAGHDNILDAIAEGKFGYDPKYEKLLRKYGRVYKGSKTNEQASRETNERDSDVFTDNDDAWMNDYMRYFDAVYGQSASFNDNSCEEKPKSFKEKVKDAEFVEAEVIDL